MKKVVIGLFAMLLLISGTSSTSLASPTRPRTVRVKAVSQNVYIGANIFRLVAGEDPNAVLATVQQTNFAERATQIAKQIRRTKPDLIGLQEVADIALTDPQGNRLVDLDYLAILLQALDDQGLPYEVGATVNNFDGSLPAGPGLTASITDRDVILYRTKTTTISNPIGTNYTASAKIPFGETSLNFLRGYTSVDATVRGREVRFINTHFETQNTPCLTSAGPVICQEAQAEELAQTLENETLPVIVVGDLNSEVDEPTFQILAEAGFENAWDLDNRGGPGFTCCQVETVDNDVSQLDQRIDHIAIRAPGARRIWSRSRVLGDSQRDRTPSGLWPADHAAPYARLVVRY